jgi:hypothetical protein
MHRAESAAVSLADLEATVVALKRARDATEKYHDVRSAEADGYRAYGALCAPPGLSLRKYPRRGNALRHATDDPREQRLDRLIGRLPQRLQAVIRWLRKPSARWVRIPAGVLLIGGSVRSILPLFGLWMLPLGLLLLAEDVPLLRRGMDRILDWIERRRPHWFSATPPPTAEDRSTRKET